MKTSKERAKRLGRLRNPVPAGNVADRPTHVAPNYPIKPQVVSATGEPFAVVCLQQEDGRYVAEILQHPEIRYVAKTRRQAELVVSKMFRERRSAFRGGAAEDQVWLELARANNGTSGVTIDEYRRRRGL